MWFYLFILLFVCVRACSRRPFLLAYVLIMYLKTKPNMINLISSRQHGLIKGIIHLSSCFAAQTSFFFSPKTVRWPIMLTVVHSHPPKAHSEPGKTLFTSSYIFMPQFKCLGFKRAKELTEYHYCSLTIRKKVRGIKAGLICPFFTCLFACFWDKGQNEPEGN